MTHPIHLHCVFVIKWTNSTSIGWTINYSKGTNFTSLTNPFPYMVSKILFGDKSPVAIIADKGTLVICRVEVSSVDLQIAWLVEPYNLSLILQADGTEDLWKGQNGLLKLPDGDPAALCLWIRSRDNRNFKIGPDLNVLWPNNKILHVYCFDWQISLSKSS